MRDTSPSATMPSCLNSVQFVIRDERARWLTLSKKWFNSFVFETLVFFAEDVVLVLLGFERIVRRLFFAKLRARMRQFVDRGQIHRHIPDDRHNDDNGNANDVDDRVGNALDLFCFFFCHNNSP